MRLPLFERPAEMMQTQKPAKREGRKKKKRFSLKRQLLSWSIMTVVILSVVLLMKRGFLSIVQGRKRQGWVRRISKRKR